MTQQEIFDFVCSKLAVQKRQAYDNGACLYLAPDGNMCAVGHILPELGLDRTVLENMQSYCGSVNSLISCFEMFLPEWFIDNEDLLRRLQIVHDDQDVILDRVNMAQRLKVIAMDYELDFDEDAFLKKAGWR